MECAKCNQRSEQFYRHQDIADGKEIVCLRCLADNLWQQRAGRVSNPDYFFIKSTDAQFFITGLQEIIEIDNMRKLYRQKNSGNKIIVEQPNSQSGLRCLDISSDINKA